MAKQRKSAKKYYIYGLSLKIGKKEDSIYVQDKIEAEDALDAYNKAREIQDEFNVNDNLTEKSSAKWEIKYIEIPSSYNS